MNIDDPSSTDSGTAVPQAVTDEELFAAYLAARVQQALETLNAARDELAAQPHDFNRAVLVMRRMQELRDLRNEFDAQRARVSAARTAAGLELPPAEEHPAQEPADQATPGAAFRTAQAEQAARIMAALATKPRTCPDCQALLAADAARCHCGYAIERSGRKNDKLNFDPAAAHLRSAR